MSLFFLVFADMILYCNLVFVFKDKSSSFLQKMLIVNILDFLPNPGGTREMAHAKGWSTTMGRPRRFACPWHSYSYMANQ